jgi:acyl-CoA dehydrogenase
MISTDARPTFDDDLNIFRDQVRKFFDKALLPNIDRWEDQGVVDREFWLACGEAGLLCPTVSPDYGGLGLDFRYNAVIGEELGYHSAQAGITLQSDVVVSYIEQLGTEQQKQKWLPRLISGEVITAIAMTEPGTGSDLQAIRTAAAKFGDRGGQDRSAGRVERPIADSGRG